VVVFNISFNSENNTQNTQDELNITDITNASQRQMQIRISQVKMLLKQIEKECEDEKKFRRSWVKFNGQSLGNQNSRRGDSALLVL